MEKKSVFLNLNAWVCKSQICKLQICKSQERSDPQIANPQSATFAEGPQIEQIINRTNYLSLKICGFVICETYLR
jgi:hypothetical protein